MSQDMSIFRLNRARKSDDKPLVGNRSMFDYVMKVSVPKSATMAAPAAPAPPVAPSSPSGVAESFDIASTCDDSDDDEHDPKRRRVNKKFSEAKKLEAVKLAEDLGVNAASRKMHVAQGTLSGWKKKYVVAQKTRLLEAPANAPPLPVTDEDKVAMLADGRASNGNRVPLAVEQALHSYFMFLRKTVRGLAASLCWACYYSVLTEILRFRARRPSTATFCAPKAFSCSRNTPRTPSTCFRGGTSTAFSSGSPLCGAGGRRRPRSCRPA